MTTDPPPPRRKWHFNRWLIVLIVAMFGWSGWRAYAFRSALSQAKALGWEVEYTDPVDAIRKNWKAAFKKATWADGVTTVFVHTGESFSQNVAIVLPLNPKGLWINNAATLRDLSPLAPLTRLQYLRLGVCTDLTDLGTLKHLPTLQKVWLEGCAALINVDALDDLPTLQTVRLDGCKALTNVNGLTNLPALRYIGLTGCTALTNLDGLKRLPALQQVEFHGSTGLTKESVASLRAALPNAQIFGP